MGFPKTFSLFSLFAVLTTLFFFMDLSFTFAQTSTQTPTVINTTELRRLMKCYGLLVGERIRMSDPLFIKVKNGESTGADACLELLNHATLGADGKFPLVNGAPDPIGAKIANQLFALHRAHISVPDPLSVLDIAADIIDANQTVYHFTYPFLKLNEPFSKVITRKKGLRAIRSAGTTFLNEPDLLRIHLRTLYPLSFTQGYYDSPAKNNLKPWNPVVLERGVLQGMTEDSNLNIPEYLSSNSSKYENAADVNAHFGAGFLGTQTYQFSSLKKPGMGDGATNVFRVFGKDAYHDAFCRDLPLVRSRDVVGEVYPNSEIPWRQSPSCMACHKSMDEFSGVARRMISLSIGYSYNSAFPAKRFNFWSNLSVPKQDSEIESAPPPTLNPDPNYWRRPPEGRLYFRNYRGDLIDRKVSSLQEMGEAMAEQDDLYICEASRLFEYLTGIQPRLGDPFDPTQPLNLTAGDKWIRELVIQYGLDLKKHQNVRETLRRMIASPLFLDPNAGAAP